jgi:hypothetical protein
MGHIVVDRAEIHYSSVVFPPQAALALPGRWTIVALAWDVGMTKTSAI